MAKKHHKILAKTPEDSRDLTCIIDTVCVFSILFYRMKEPVAPKLSKKRIPLLRCITVIVIFISGFFLSPGCDVSGYQYYIRTNELKPLLITIVDQSGSMDSYQSAVMNLVDSSLDILVDKLYNGDQETMEQHSFVVGCANGEWWTRALCTAPSDLMPTPAGLLVPNNTVNNLSDKEYTDFLKELDAYPVRVYLFYGNGGAPDTSSAEFSSSYNTFVSEDYDSLLINKGIVVAVPGSTTAFINGSKDIISGSMGMHNYGWQLQQYDPGAADLNGFAENLIGIVSE